VRWGGADEPGTRHPRDRRSRKLFSILVHVLTGTNRHADHADILREQLDGAIGTGAGRSNLHGRDTDSWANHRAKIEHAAKKAEPPQD